MNFTRFLKYSSWNPRYISALVASILMITSTGLFYLLIPHLWVALLLSLTLSGLVYLLIRRLMEEYIFGKIKLIYRFIDQQELGKQKSLDDVQKDVELWSENRSEEFKKLQQNNEFRKEFLQNLSHELKTPIFTIQGYIDTLQEGAIDNKQVATRFLDNASKGVDRLVALTKSLDDISRLESGRIILDKKNFDLQELLSDVFEELALEAKSQGVELQMPKNRDKILAHADPAQIRQGVVNLLENAIKYCEPGDKIYFNIYKIDRNKVITEITDTGPGIEEEHLSRIFERFYRTDKSRSRNIGGTGLGLAITKHIIEAHEESITCRSHLGKGSTFAFTLPSA